MQNGSSNLPRKNKKNRGSNLFPKLVCDLGNVDERQKIAQREIGKTLSLLNHQIQWVHDNYCTFAKVEYFGGDKSKKNKWIKIELNTWTPSVTT